MVVDGWRLLSIPLKSARRWEVCFAVGSDLLRHSVHGGLSDLLPSLFWTACRFCSSSSGTLLAALPVRFLTWRTTGLLCFARRRDRPMF